MNRSIVSSSSGWTDRRIGIDAVKSAAEVKLLARIMACAVTDYYSPKEPISKSAEVYLFDDGTTTEDFGTFSWLCQEVGLTQKSICQAINMPLPNKLKSLAKLGTKHNKKAVEFVFEMRRFILNSFKYKERPKKVSRRKQQ